MLTGCSSRALHEAQDVVKTADSLRAEGVAYTDSMALAEAYNTLEKWQYLYPTDYARACYYYGRLLRNNDDPVAAMQVFINGTHSHTRDYHILARTYSNMGSICHLASEYQLSYDMYSRSADMFLKNGDTLLYYHSLNNMAIEQAVQGKKESTLELISIIWQNSSNPDLIMQTMETEAEMYFQRQQYDSALFYTSKALKYNPHSTSSLLVRAQTYSFMHVGDSAVHYAKLVLKNTDEPCNINNALYILTNDDETKDKQSIRETAANRSDVQKILEIRQGKLSQAVHTLEQDLHKRPNLLWLYAIIATLAIVSSIIIIYRRHQQRRHNLIKQHIADLQVEAYKTQELHDELKNEVSHIQENKLYQLEQMCEALRSSKDISKELKWKDFDGMCEMIDTHFYLLTSKLRQQNLLSEQEIRLCVLVLLDLSRNQMADMLNYSQNGMGKFKYRIAQKLSTEGKNLRTYLINIAIGTPINGK